jgi:hypothetical protein
MIRAQSTDSRMKRNRARSAGKGLSGWGRAGSAVHEVERVVGGKLHDAALAQAVEEARPNFRQCPSPRPYPSAVRSAMPSLTATSSAAIAGTSSPIELAPQERRLMTKVT